jgi:D-alanyl-D-alanine carboxypeptidase/D-alanyl-D-alanine-endopeptidase (penicillin-binding protein 4)
MPQLLSVQRVLRVVTCALLAVGTTLVVPPVLSAAPAAQQQARKRQPKRPTPAKRPATRSSRATTRRARTPVVPVLRYTTPRGASALGADLGTLLTSRTRTGEWGAMVISITRGDTLFAHRPDQQILPASTMKLFTSAIALDRLGPEHAFSTDVLREGSFDPVTGTLRGNLILRGDGDPSLSPRFVRGGPDAPMTMLAQFTAGAGIKRVMGDLIADASAFESRRIPDGWLTRYAGAGYAAPFSALSLDENIVIVGVSSSDGSAKVFLEPATTGLAITNTVRVVPGGGSRISARRVGDDRVVVSGTIGARAGTVRYQLVVGDPVTFTGGAFKAALESQGVRIEGALKVGRTPENATLVTSLPSPPLAKLISVMNRESINHLAEMLFRNAPRGVERKGIGSAETGNATLQEFLTRQVGARADAVVASDGSGLSVLDRVTPRAMVQLLDHAHHASWGSAFHASLPVAGESELLRNRMRATPAQGNLHAKTGTTNEVIGLAGYVTAENGEILAFAFLYNGRDRWAARETIDAMGPTLAAFSRD